MAPGVEMVRVERAERRSDRPEPLGPARAVLARQPLVVGEVQLHEQHVEAIGVSERGDRGAGETVEHVHGAALAAAVAERRREGARREAEVQIWSQGARAERGD